jgi:hypothetical protein
MIRAVNDDARPPEGGGVEVGFVGAVSSWLSPGDIGLVRALRRPATRLIDPVAHKFLVRYLLGDVGGRSEPRLVATAVTRQMSLPQHLIA